MRFSTGLATSQVLGCSVWTYYNNNLTSEFLYKKIEIISSFHYIFTYAHRFFPFIYSTSLLIYPDNIQGECLLLAVTKHMCFQ